MEELNISQTVDYSDSNIITLEGLEHVRRRPGMYIGKLGDGSHADDGIYVLLKEVLDNCIDEFRMGAGKMIDVRVSDGHVEVRDYGRGIPLGKMIDAVSIMNTGGKYDSKAFKKSVGLNGVGTKAVNALSSTFIVQSYRDGQSRRAEFMQGKLVQDSDIFDDNSDRGTYVYFVPDETLFSDYKYQDEFIETMLRKLCVSEHGINYQFQREKDSFEKRLARPVERKR